MSPPSNATIFARSSGPGRAGVAVYRISGPRAGEVLDRMTGGKGRPRRARLTRLRLGDGSVLDEGLALWFPGPASFTGDDVAELHLHGSVAVERRLSEELIALGLYPATAGAFTLRAFEAGKLDLTQAEGLGDLLDAETEGQRRQALGQLGGRLSELAGQWREHLLSMLALLEAAIDFPDEEDVPGGVADGLGPMVAELRAGMRDAIEASAGARRTREGVVVAITGPPNAGKSSILNRLAGEERAIVSAQAGTTRDVVAVRVEVAGQLVTLLDTAGIRDAEDEVERIGVERARRAAEEADLRLLVHDMTLDLPPLESAERTILVANKCDLASIRPLVGWLTVSTRTGEGWEALMERLRDAVSTGGAGPLTRDRHLQIVQAAERALEQVESQAEGQGGVPEITAERLRQVVLLLDELVGRISPEEVLGSVFSSFCIGK